MAETIDDLELSGCTLDSPKSKALLRTTLNGFGVQLDGNHKALVVRTTAKDFALKKHNLLQAMLAVNDLFYLATPMVRSFFVEDVEAWLRISDIPLCSLDKVARQEWLRSSLQLHHS